MNVSFYNPLRTLLRLQSPCMLGQKSIGLAALFWVLSIVVPLHAQTGGALNFDGSNDHVTFPNAGLSASAGTMEFWVNTVSNGSTQMYIDLYQEQFTIYSTGTTLRARIAGTDLSAPFTPNQWNHLALTWSGNGATARLYLNGVQVASGTQGGTTIAASTGYLSRSQAGSFYPVNSTMDEVRLWSVARSAADIAANYCSEVATNASGLQAYYKFNQGTASGNNSGVTSLTDATANGRNGTLVNFGLTGSASNWVAGNTWVGAVTPSVSIAGSPNGSIAYGTSVTFTATPTNGGTTPAYQWKKNNVNVGTNSVTYTDAALNNGDVITCVMTSNALCATTTTATSNSVTMTVNYPAGAALHFDGTNDYVQVAHSASLNDYVNTGEITVEYWIKPVFPASGNANIIAKRSGNNGFVFEMNTAGLTRHYFRTSNNTWAYIDATYTNNVWQHVAVTAKTDNTISVYINGVLASSASMAGFSAFVASTSAMRLMANTETLNSFQQGAIDEVRLWNRVLPLCEIQNNRDCELGSGQTGLMAYYKFNQGFGFTSNAGVTSLTDASGNSNTGTLTNLGLTGTTSNWVATGGVTTGTTCTPRPTPSVSIAITTGNQTICAGTSVTFTATPTNGGTSPTYQWKKGGVNISGATNATYTSTSLANSDAITCVLTSNATCATTTTATSNSIAMMVNPLVTPSVSVAATATNITVGTSVTFTATPTNGGTTPTYQWKRNGTDISGATNATYTSTTLANADTITCVMTSSATCPSPTMVTSNSVVMTVYPLLTITKTQDSTYCFGSNATLTSSCSDPAAIPTWTGPNGFSASTANIVLSSLKNNNAGLYFITYSPAVGAVVKDSIFVGVHPQLATNKTVSKSTILSGTPTTIDVKGGYKNLRNTKIQIGSNAIVFNDSTLSLAPILNNSNQIFPTIIYSNGLRSVDVPVCGFEQQKYLREHCLGRNYVLDATVLSSFTGCDQVDSTTPFILTYYKGKYSAIFLKLPVSFSNSPSTAADSIRIIDVPTPSWMTIWNDGGAANPRIVSPTATTTYIATLTNEVGCNVKDTTTIQVVPPTVVNIAATALTVCQNQPTTLTASLINNVGIAKYTWQSSPDSLVWTTIIGDSTNTYAPPTSVANGTYYRVIVTNAIVDTTFYAPAILIRVNPILTPSVSIAASATSVPEGTSVTFTATPTHGGMTPQYQWQKSGVNISGATNATYTTTSLANGDVITCILTSNATCATSTTATSNSLTMTVTPPLGAALHFDGVNDYAQIPHSTSLNAFATTGEITIEFWVKPITVSSGKRMLIGKRSNSHADGFAIETAIDGTTNHWFCTTKGWKTAYIPYANDTWQHIAVTAKSGDAIRVYRNGVLSATTPLVDANLIGTNANMRFMLDPIYTTPVHAGALDEVRIWSRVLPQCEIQNNMNCELGSGQTSLAAYYKFNQGLGNTNNAGITTLTDASGNNNNGTLLNFALTGMTSNWVAQGGVVSGTTCPPAPIVTPSVSIAASATTIAGGTSVTFTATPTNGGTTPFYQWKKNNANVGANSPIYSDAALINGDVISCVMTVSGVCAISPTTTSNTITMTVTGSSPATALNFDGVDDYVTVPAGNHFGTNITLESWVYPKSFTKFGRIIDFGNGNNVDAVVLTYSAESDGYPVFYIANIPLFLKANRKLSLNQWNHVAATLNGTTASIYVNGVLAGTMTVNTPLSSIVRNNCYIGKSNHPADGFLNASLDEVRIWNRALSQCEIQNNMTGELGSGQTSLLAYYKLNQGSVNSNNAGVTTLIDASGNDRNATLNGFGLTGTTSNWVSGGGIAAGTTAAAYVTPSVSINSVTACVGTSPNLTATLTGFGTKTAYQWEVSTNNVAFSNASFEITEEEFVGNVLTKAIVVPPTNTAGTRYYRLKVTDACGVVYSAGTAFTVTNPNLTVTANATQVCQNSVATLTAATATGTPQYQWQSSTNRSTWTNVSGATAATFAPATSTLGTAYYRVVAAYGSGCTLRSEAQTLTVGAAPTASATGGNVTVGQGSSAGSLTAVINSPFASVFQWQSSADGSTGWTDIANSNVLTYTPSTATVGTLHYRLKVTFAATTNVCNAVIYSNVRKITVEAAPSVTITASGATPRSSGAYCAGSTITLISTCSDATATPTWTGPNGFTATTANITLSNVSSTNAGLYRVTYLTQTGHVGVQSTMVNILPTLSNGSSYAAHYVSSGHPEVLDRVLDRVRKLVDQTVGLAGFFIFNQGTTVSYELSGNSINKYWRFIPVVINTDNLNPSLSNRFYIQSANNGLFLSSNSTNPSVVEMNTFVNNANFQWTLTTNSAGKTILRNGNGLSLSPDAPQLVPSEAITTNITVTEAPSNISVVWNDGVTGATRIVSPTTTTTYIATLTDSQGCSANDTTTVIVVPTPTVSVTASATNVCRNASTMLTTTVTNNIGATTYQWQSKVNNTTWTNIAGATNSTYSAPTATLGSVYYRVVATDSIGTFTADSVQITVVVPPSVSVSASQKIVCLNGVTTLTASYPTGFGTPTVQWQSSNDSTVWANIAGANSDTYQPPTATGGKIFYRYIVGLPNACITTIKSQGIGITVNASLTATISGVATQSVCKGSYRVFTLTTNVVGATYAWETSTNGTTWTPIANATAASYIVPTTTVGTTYYRGTVISDCSAMSATRQVTVTQAAQVTVGSPVSSTCLDRPVSFTASMTGDNSLLKGCIWETSTDNLNWTRQTGIRGISFTPSASVLGTTYVRVGIKNTGCVDSSYSVPKTLAVNANPVVTIIGVDLPLVRLQGASWLQTCSNSLNSLKVTVTGGTNSPTFQWLKYTSNFGSPLPPQDIAGATSDTYTVPIDANILAVPSYGVRVSSANCPTVTSQTIKVLQASAPLILSARASGSVVCQGSTVNLTSSVLGNCTYQWQSSPDGTTWTNILNATSSAYSFIANTVGTTQYRLSALVNSCNPVLSSPIPVSVNTNSLPTLSLAANNATLCGQTDVIVTATATNLGGGTPQYEWRRNGQLFVGQNLSFVTKTTADGLGSNTINDVAVKDSTLYVATDGGLSISIDGGATFVNKTTANGLPDNKVTALGIQANGSSIIVGTSKGPAISRDGGNSFVTLFTRFISTNATRTLPFNVPSIGVSPDGKTVFISVNEFGGAQTFQHDFGLSNQINRVATVAPVQIKFKDNNTAYLLTNNGAQVANKNSSGQFSFSTASFSQSSLSYERIAFRGDTIFTSFFKPLAGSYFLYHVNGVSSRTSGLPRAGLSGDGTSVTDFAVNGNMVYATHVNSGLYLSKDGGRNFVDITNSTTGLGTDKLSKLTIANGQMYITSSGGLKISAANTPSITFSTTQSDKIECVMTLSNGGCTSITKQSLTLNYIADVDPLSIKVTSEGTTSTGTWTAVNNAQGYGWELMKFSPDRSTKTFVSNGVVTTNSVTLSNLNPSSNYELTVKTLCNVTPSTRFARLSNVPGAGSGVSTSFTTGFVVPQAIKDSLLKVSTLCAEDSLILGPGFPNDYQVNIYSGTDKSFIDYASAIHPFRVKLTADIKYFYKVVKFDVKTYTFTASNNDAGSESKRYTVPTGVSQITFKVAGSKGGSLNGGKGGVTIGSVTPTAGATYYLFPGTTTTADAGLSRGTSRSANGGGGSYVSTTSLRTNAIIVAGGGGGGDNILDGQKGGDGGLIGGNGYTGVTGGNATSGGSSYPATGSIWTTIVNQRTASGFMKGSSTNNVTATQRRADYGGGGGYYGGGSSVEVASKQAGGGGGSSYANTAVVSSVLYEDGANNGAGYVTLNEYYQVTANSDFLPLDIVRMPVPVLANQLVTVTPNPVISGSNFQASVSLTGNQGFATTYKWNNSSSQTTQSATYVANGLRLIACDVSVAYCTNRVRVSRISTLLPSYAPIPPNSGSNRGGRLLTPSVSIASSATNICGGEQVIFTATPTNVVDENLSYTWYKNGEIVFGQSNNVLQTNSLSNGDVITCTLFYPSATTGADSVASTNSVMMTVATPATPSVTIAASVNNVCPSTSITFTPTPTAGGSTPQYQWYLNGDYVQTSATYTSSSFENSDYVACIMASNASCITQTESEISANVSIQLKPTVTPTATVFVLDTLICAGSPTSLSVRTEDVGTTPQYQWRHNGAPVGNNADYYPTSVSNNDAIWCEVTPSADACANTSFVQSNTELIQTAVVGETFTPLATITMDKDSVCTGDSLTFSVEGNYLGSTPQYVWKKNGTVLQDLTDPFITLSSIANGDIITCVATSSLTCVTAAEATSNALTVKMVNPATPVVTIATPNTTICPNIPVVISATPTHGGLFPQYNWRLNGNAHNALPHEFINYTTANGLGNDYTNAVFVRNDTVYAATIGGLSYKIKGDSIYSLSYDKGLATSNVQAIFADDSGVYAGTDEGLSISTDGLVSFRPINTASSGLSSGNITAITAIGSTLFVGTDNGLNISTNGGKSFTAKKTTEGLASNRVRHLFVDGTTLYVGTEGGLNVSTNNGTTFTTKTIADSLNSDTILGIWAKGAAIYAATQQGLAISEDGGNLHQNHNGAWFAQ
jgi:hypothetical protein